VSSTCICFVINIDYLKRQFYQHLQVFGVPCKVVFGVPCKVGTGTFN
jgi:hypothetical protein